MCTFRLTLLLTCFSFLFWYKPAVAWDTAVRGGLGKTDWRSIYESIAVQKNGGVLLHGNEHAEISATALIEIGAGKLLETSNLPVVVDLNASLFRRDLLQNGQTWQPSDVPDDGLERRILPPPPQFSGVPDFSYSLYDWINKNLLCPLPDDAPQRHLCHDYSGWIGAALNASHFGSQAARNYIRLHRVAMELADRAKRLRLRLRQTSGAEEAYRDHLIEAEWMALAYEGVAQHFLADRWSTGHMWERWNAGDYQNLSTRRPIVNVLVGVISGMLHGMQSFLHGKLLFERRAARTLWPDPLSSPWVRFEHGGHLLNRLWDYYMKGEQELAVLKEIQPAIYRHEKGSGHPAIGDYGFRDLLDGSFGGVAYGFKNELPLPLPQQKKEMLACIKGGWADVIRAFGRNRERGYGALRISLKEDAPSLETLKDRCFDIYVTNRSMMLAWPFSKPTFWSQLGRATLTVLSDKRAVAALKLLAKGNALSAGATQLLQQKLEENLKAGRLAARNMVRISYQLWKEGRRHPGSTELARGGLRPLDFSLLDPSGADVLGMGIVETGERYPAASYLEESLQGLPESGDPAGRDKEAIYGFFSRATADYWGQRMPALFERLRGSREPWKRSLCLYLAEFAYDGTEEGYEGKQKEERLYHGRSLPSYLTSLGMKAGGKGIPSRLPPGYVSSPGNRDAQGRYRSLGAWCDRVPLLELDEQTELKNQDVVFSTASPDEVVALDGADLGETPGRVWIDCVKPGVEGNPVEVVSWSDDSIHLRLPSGLSPGDHPVCVQRADGVFSVGRFILRIEGKPLRIAGRVLEKETKEAVEGATVSLELGRQRFEAVSGKEGNYHIEIQKRDGVPDALILVAEKEGYATASVSVGRRSYEQADLLLSPTGKSIVQVDSQLHHLGDGRYEGAVNSRFQKPQAEGIRWQGEFVMPDLEGVVGALLTLSVRGVQRPNPILLNGKQVGVLPNSNEDGSASQVRVPLDVCALHVGSNLLALESVAGKGMEDRDDFEFANIQLHLQFADDLDFGDLRLAPLNDIRVMLKGGSETADKVKSGDLFFIEGKGKGKCATRRDVALVQVYLKRLGEGNGKNVLLLETDVDSGVFRSSEPLSASLFSAKEGDRLVVRAGLRGASIQFVSGDEKSKENEEIEELRRRWRELRFRWKTLSDHIDRLRSEGRPVDDLMRNLRSIASQIQEVRAELAEAEERAGLARPVIPHVQKK